MNGFYEGIEVLGGFIELFILYRIYYLLVQDKRRISNQYIDLFFVIGGTILIRICNHIIVFSYVTLLVIVLYTSISAMFIYKVNYAFLFLCAGVYVLCLSAFDFLLFTCVSGFFGGYETFINLISMTGIFRIIMIVITQLMKILIFLLVKRYVHCFSVKNNYIFSVSIILSAGFFSFIYLANQTFKAFYNSITGTWLVFLAFFLLLLFGVYTVIKKREQKMKLNFIEIRNKLLEKNYKTISDIYTSNAKLYHDLNNHLNVLYQLLEEGKEQEAREYIKEISQPVKNLSKTIWTGIDVVDVIINSKIERMRETGITYDINVEFPRNTNILPHDICTILANLLDNAIEAVEKEKDFRAIVLTIRRINDFLLIKVCNSCEVESEKFSNYPVTTKENKMLHGWGLPSVKDAVEKYHGTLKCEKKENQFVVVVMLFYEIMK